MTNTEFPFFTPNRNALQWWLYTKKTELTSFGVKRPGLFSTINITWLALGVMGIILLEGVATFWSFDEGVRIEAILASVGVDFVLAILSHIPQKKIIKIKNLMVFEKGTKLSKAKRNIKYLKFIQNLLFLGIIVSGFLKFFWFYITYAIMDATALFIFVCYLIGALLHVVCTGYFIFSLIFQIIISQQKNGYIDSDGEQFSFDPASPVKSYIHNGFEENQPGIALIETKVGNHEIRKIDEKYYFITNGILTDDQLNEIIGSQTNSTQQNIIAIEGVKAQYNMLG